MDARTEALGAIDATRKFFDNTTRCLEEKDSGFRATPDTMTVAGQVAHVAQTIDWFRAGAFHDAWDLDWEKLATETAAVGSLTDARRWLAEAWQRLRAEVEAMPEAKLAETMADNPILPGMPRAHAIPSLVDHTAHHRGALAVYARLLGRTPAMPYAES